MSRKRSIDGIDLDWLWQYAESKNETSWWIGRNRFNHGEYWVDTDTFTPEQWSAMKDAWRKHKQRQPHT